MIRGCCRPACYGVKEETGAKVEVLLLKQEEGDVWETLVKPAKRVKRGTVLSFGDGRLTAVCTEELEHGGRKIEFRYEGIFYEVLESLGEMPLPPYIKEQLDDRNAIKRFTQRNKDRQLRRRPGCILRKRFSMRTENKGVHIAFITLHVGLGTFRPVSAEIM